MNRRTVAISVIVLVAVIVVISFAAAFMLSPQQQPNSPTPTPAATPTQQATNTPTTPAPASTSGTDQFSPTVTVSYLNIEGIPNPMSYFNTTTAVTSGSHEFSINVTNPQSSSPSPQPCNLEVVLTEKSKTAASQSDALLGIDTMGKDQNGQPDPSYSSFTPLNATVSGNKLVFLFAPAGQYWEPYIEKLSSTGFTVSSGFDESFEMMLVLASSGQYDLSVNLVPVS